MNLTSENLVQGNTDVKWMHFDPASLCSSSFHAMLAVKFLITLAFQSNKHLALFSLRTESDNPVATCELTLTIK